MSDRWLGIVVSSDVVTIVDAEVPDQGNLVIQADLSRSLQTGDRPGAYCVMHQRVQDYARENGITRAIIKGSAVSMGGTRMAHLEAAELRGVVTCALSGVTKTDQITKALMSRTFGSRKVDEYVADRDFWNQNVSGDNAALEFLHVRCTAIGHEITFERPALGFGLARDRRRAEMGTIGRLPFCRQLSTAAATSCSRP